MKLIVLGLNQFHGGSRGHAAGSTVNERINNEKGEDVKFLLKVDLKRTI